MLDKSKLKELDASKVICVSWKNDWDDIIAYYFVFNDNKIYMESSSNGNIYIADINDIDTSNINNWKTINRWYRMFGIEIVCHIIVKKLQDAEIFEECSDNDIKLTVSLGERDNEGNILEWITSSKFEIGDYI